MITLYVRFFVTPWTVVRQAPLSFIISQSLLKLMSIESVIPSNHLTLCHRLLLLPSVFPSTRVFSNEIALWIMGQSIGISVSASVLPMSIQGWFPLGLTGLILLCKGLSRVLQHHNLKASILQCSVFLMVQLSHHDYWENHSFDYMDLCWQRDVCAFEFAV